MTTGREGTRFTTRRITLAQGEDLLLAAVHMPNKRDYSDEGQATEAQIINNDILMEEELVGHRRTLARMA